MESGDIDCVLVGFGVVFEYCYDFGQGSEVRLVRFLWFCYCVDVF